MLQIFFKYPLTPESDGTSSLQKPLTTFEPPWTHSVGCSSTRPTSRSCSACIRSQWCRLSQTRSWRQPWQWDIQHVPCRTTRLHTRGNLDRRCHRNKKTSVWCTLSSKDTVSPGKGSSLSFYVPLCLFQLDFFTKTDLDIVHQLDMENYYLNCIGGDVEC